MTKKIRIEPAQPHHASEIAQAVMDAVGGEICVEFAGADHTVEDVKRMFTHLASMDDAQYSYRNSLVALDDEDNVAGVCVSYDGADLHRMREHFFNAAEEFVGKKMRGMADETSADEYYLDSLAVNPAYRGYGIGSKLLMASVEKARAIGKPAGLLVDLINPKAEALYRRLGFEYVDDRPFAGVVMHHMQMK